MKLLNYSLNHFYKDLKKTYKNKMGGSDSNQNLGLIKRAYIEVVLI